MSLLDFNESSPKRTSSRKPFKLVLGIGTLVATIALGSTLAASINLNAGGPVEFGQGVTQTTSCDSQVEVTPLSSFVNLDGSGYFQFSAITLSDLDGTTQTDASDEGCAGKSFTIKSYGEDGMELGQISTISLDSNGNFSSPDGDIDGTGEGTIGSAVTLTFSGMLPGAEFIYRITVESSSSNSIVGATTMIISTGRDFTCEILESGNVQCWGSNEDGQVGDGTTTNRSTPVAVIGLSGVSAISGGGDHACALLNSGSVKCWGYNGDGQLGDGTTDDRSGPVLVSGISDVSAIAAGRDHTCALFGQNGDVKCWGYNEDGQLGDGSNASSTAPVTVSDLSGVAEISAGDSHSCALLLNGQVRCWGANNDNQLGDGTDLSKTTPVAPYDLSGVAAISAGNSHTCALLLLSGDVKCWGANEFGQLGNGTSTLTTTPVNVSDLSGVISITAGGNHTCALLATENVKCWGKNDEGQLGDGTTNDRSTPGGTISGLDSVLMISAGNNHTCALLESRVVKCWGGNGDGRLGDGTEEDRLTPVAVSREF